MQGAAALRTYPEGKWLALIPLGKSIIMGNATEEQRTEHVWKSQVSGSALVDHPIHASRALTKMSMDVTHKLFSCALLNKSLFTTYLSMSVANIFSLVLTTFGRCLQELLRDWKAMPRRKSVPSIFLQRAASLSPLIAVGSDSFFVCQRLTVSFSIGIANVHLLINCQILLQEGEGWLLIDASLHPELETSSSHILDCAVFRVQQREAINYSKL